MKIKFKPLNNFFSLHHLPSLFQNSSLRSIFLHRRGGGERNKKSLNDEEETKLKIPRGKGTRVVKFSRIPFSSRERERERGVTGDFLPVGWEHPGQRWMGVVQETRILFLAPANGSHLSDRVDLGGSGARENLQFLTHHGFSNFFFLNSSRPVKF